MLLNGEAILAKKNMKNHSTNKGIAIIVSGYFNPIHTGHLDMLQEASRLGSALYVIVNNDKQVKIKGSVPFMNEEERLRIVRSIKGVSGAAISIDEDSSVSESLAALHIAILSDGFDNIIFANGGDRKKAKDIPEYEICSRLGIRMIFGIGGDKTQSSSTLIKEASKKTK